MVFYVDTYMINILVFTMCYVSNGGYPYGEMIAFGSEASRVSQVIGSVPVI